MLPTVKTIFRQAHALTRSLHYLKRQQFGQHSLLIRIVCPSMKTKPTLWALFIARLPRSVSIAQVRKVLIISGYAVTDQH
jgi:hypothetical protein